MTNTTRPLGQALRVRRTLKPGQPGTLKLQRRYAQALVSVRYRENAEGTIRYTTVELIVDEAPVQRRLSDRTLVGVHIAWNELSLSTKAKAMGAKWEAGTRLWRMSYKAAKALGITQGIRPKLSIGKQAL